MRSRRSLVSVVSVAVLATTCSVGVRPPTVAGAAGTTDAACPADAVPDDGFTDVAWNATHEWTIDCMVWWGIASGRTATAYEPGRSLTRAQVATFLARLVEAAGVELDGSTDHFDDDDGNPHEPRINQMASYGVISGTGPRMFSPERSLTRGQMASLVVKTYEQVLHQTAESSQDHFDDDDGNLHEPRINAAADLGLVSGVADATFAPTATVPRGQMATFLARLLDSFVAEGVATPPPSAGGHVHEPPPKQFQLTASFKGLDQWTRSDTGTAMPTVAAGPSSLVLVTNDRMGIFTKTGESIAQGDPTQLFRSVNSAPEHQGSAYQRIIFDPDSQRFFLGASGRDIRYINADPPCELGECVADFFLAVSKDATPTSVSTDDWHVYAFDWTRNNDTVTRTYSGWVNVGLTSDAVALVAEAVAYQEEPVESGPNEFPEPPESYGKIRVMAKAPLLQGTKPEWTDIVKVPEPHRSDWDVVPYFAAPYPTVAHDDLLLISERGGSCNIVVWEVVDPLGLPTMRYLDTPVEGECLAAEQYADQPGDWPLWNFGPDSRFLGQPMRTKDSILGTRTLGAPPEGGRTHTQWVQVDVSRWPDETSVVQSGFVGAEGQWHDFSAVAGDDAGNLVMIYRRASADQPYSLDFVTRTETEPLGQFGVPETLKESESTHGFYRGGYYTDTAVDPSDGSFWIFGQYTVDSRRDCCWSTWVGRLGLVDER